VTKSTTPDEHVFEGHSFSTIGGLFATALWAAENGKADEFLSVYRALSKNADENLGYVIGYGDTESRKLMYEAYKVTHPALGGTP
jgi:hypothetical protein